MHSLKIFIIFTTFLSLSRQTPLNSNNSIDDFRTRAEHKNWKLKSDYYNNKIDSHKYRDDSPLTFRLPNDTIPIRYDIHLTTDVDKSDFNFYGRVKMHIRAVHVTNVVTLNYRDITVSKVSLIDVLTQKVLNNQLNFSYEPAYEFLKINLSRTLQVDDEVVLEIVYSGVLKNNDVGFYRAYYTVGEKRIYYAVTQFESTDARYAFPCYDEPAIRATIGLQIQHHKTYNADSNMPLISEIPVEGTDYVTSTFSDTPPMQTYILAFLVSPFDFVSNNDSQIPQRILAKPSSIASGSADFAASIADAIIKKLVNHFGINYTLPKLDHAAITQFSAGAMENWGLVTYRENYLLFTSTNDTTKDELLKQNIIQTMAHEDAHQFFGNLVAPHWWSDLWMNEGFATLYEYYIPHLLYPTDGYMESFRLNEINYCFYFDVLSRQTVPMHYYVESPEEIDDRFDTISYSKSGVVLHMFQEALSESTFTKGLTKYMSKMSLKAAVPNDLFSSIQDSYDDDYPNNSVDIIQAMSSWVYQAGYPLIQIEKVENGNLKFTQRRYPGSSGEIYTIPLSFATNGQSNFNDTRASIWLTEEVTIIQQKSLGMSDDDWIILNIQQTGYYRVAYSSELWRAIGKGLQQNYNQIHVVNRRVLQTELQLGLSVLDSILASDVLDVLSYLVNENEYAVWSDAGKSLKDLSASLFGTSAYSDYLRFMRFISRKQLDAVGMEPIDGESLDITNLRNQVKTTNCYAFDEDCLGHELAKLILYLENEHVYPVPDFCSAFRNANSTIYAHYLNEVAENAKLSYRDRIIESIGCSFDENLLKLTALIVDDDKNILTDSERLSIINNMMMSSLSGFKIAFEYLERNIDKISYFRLNLGAAVTTSIYVEKTMHLLEIARNESFITNTDAQFLLNSIDMNKAWQERHLAYVQVYFSTFNVETTTERQQTTASDNDDTTNKDIKTTTPGNAPSLILSSLPLILWIIVQISSH